MNKEFIPKELEQDMIDLGMTYKVLASKKYNGIPVNDIVEEWTVGILYSTVFRWFREKYGLIGWVQGKRFFMYCIENDVQTDGQLNLSPFKTYEEAELACLKKLIEIAKNK